MESLKAPPLAEFPYQPPFCCMNIHAHIRGWSQRYEGDQTSSVRNPMPPAQDIFVTMMENQKCQLLIEHSTVTGSPLWAASEDTPLRRKSHSFLCGQGMFKHVGGFCCNICCIK